MILILFSLLNLFSLAWNRLSLFTLRRFFECHFSFGHLTLAIQYRCILKREINKMHERVCQMCTAREVINLSQYNLHNFHVLNKFRINSHSLHMKISFILKVLFIIRHLDCINERKIACWYGISRNIRQI